MDLNFEISGTNKSDLSKAINLLPIWELPVGWGISESGALLLWDQTGPTEMHKFPFEVTHVCLKSFIDNWMSGRTIQLRSDLRPRYNWHLSANPTQRSRGITLMVTKTLD